MSEKEKELWKLVNRISGEIYFDNLTHEKGEELLLSTEKPDKVLVPIEYNWTEHTMMGKLWA